MKKYLFIVLLLLFSCEEKPERCAICQTTSYVNGDSEYFYKGKSFIACDRDLEVLNGRVTKVMPEDNAGYTMISITRCELK